MDKREKLNERYKQALLDVARVFDADEVLASGDNKVHHYTDRLLKKIDDEFTLYIIGPMSNKPAMNCDEFIRAKFKLMNPPYNVKAFIPHERIHPDTPWIEAVSQSLLQIDKATAVCTLPYEGLNKSYGHGIELAATIASDVLCFDLMKWLNFFQSVINDGE